MKNSVLRRFGSVVLSAAMLLTMLACTAMSASAADSRIVHITIKDVVRDYSFAADLVDSINAQRSSLGTSYPAFTIDENVEEDSMARAAELPILTQNMDLQMKMYADMEYEPEGDPNSQYFEAVIASTGSVSEIVSTLFSKYDCAATVKAKKATEIGVGVITINGDTKTRFICVRTTNEKTNNKCLESITSAQLRAKGTKALNQETLAVMDALTLDSVSSYNGTTIKKGEKKALLYKSGNYDGLNYSAYIIPEFLVSSLEIVGYDYEGNIIGKKQGTATVTMLLNGEGNRAYSETVTINVEEDKVPLENNSSVSSEKVNLGEKVALTGAAAGGTAPYKFAFYYKKHSAASWIALGTEFGDETEASFKPGSAVYYDVKISVRDSDNTQLNRIFSINVVDTSPALINNSTISSTAVVAGDEVTLTAIASGGKAPYTYALMFKKKDNTKWTKIGEKYGTASVGSFTPGKAVPYDIMINVKDSTGKIKSKSFTLEVLPKLTNTSTISASSVKLGTAVTLNASADGGIGPYTYALMYKKSSGTTWTKIGKKYGTESVGSFTPGKAVPYDIRINVKDSTGKIKTKNFTIEVTK